MTKLTIAMLPSIPANSTEFTAFINELFGPFAALVPLASIDYAQIPNAPVMTYTYAFKAVDGRTWKQVIEWPGGFSLDPVVAFPADDTKGRWSIDEFQKHIAFRSTIFTLTKKFGITELHVNWLV